MSFQQKLRSVQSDLNKQKVAGWLLYDFRGSNSLARQFLEIPSEQMSTRRFFYWIPQQGEPVKIVSSIEPHTLDHLPGQTQVYRGWQELERIVASLLSKGTTIAMEYSPDNAIPVVSKVDGGTLDFIRKQSVTVISSAPFIQPYTSVWSPEQLESHLIAATILSEIAADTWNTIVQAIHSGSYIDEYQVQQMMLHEMEKKGCETADAPICAVNAHSADPHYSPKREKTTVIRRGDFILLDLWCKQKQPSAVYADITRVGVVAERPTEKQQEIFQIVKRARDVATQFIRTQYRAGQPIVGWQVDQICRAVINQAGYGSYFIHRTGHHIGEEVHGPGTNLDNLETHDVRLLIPNTGFSVEPGIYLPNEFGVRLEYDVYLDSSRDILITGGIQEEILCLS